MSKRLADMRVGKATDSLAKGQGGGHRITGIARIKRGFPDAKGVPQARSIAAQARRAFMGGPLSFYGPFR
ncbi:hypothetical protein EN871_25555 [bacterium M00.F.Ca.ET.228.01.1.1]|uniref:hypothetical protein n=2 Tax=Paraburkholderia phenoliruptrix TaxID=252970 RepID=UPI001092F8D3|nr:hypothetical protein [Paraburkholderia phenoliruptrix]TGP41094.1 hypothetical protein EN871_25555 [bacterium M00.F.Ca.ET.228.01.1.1]TGU09088.1 hypothetical protein EN798_08205 [bacterium M00.F.Ca.ET.155.01.1.1]